MEPSSGCGHAHKTAAHGFEIVLLLLLLLFRLPKRIRLFHLRLNGLYKSLCLALSNGKIIKKLRPGIVALIQSHGDELNANPHLHQITSNGLFDYRDKENITFHPCNDWNVSKITQFFREILIKLMVKKEVLSEKLSDNLLSWKHSGFHVHASDPFDLDDREGLISRLSYAGRPPVAVSRLEYKNNIVYYKTKNGLTLSFSPLDFIALITSHIPDHYQNVRRYCGFYASNVQRTLPKKENKDDNKASVSIDEDKPVNIGWASLIARIFGELPTICPKCGKEMKLKRFLQKEEEIIPIVPWFKRAPPKITFPKFDEVSESIEYIYDDHQEMML
ncbi:MAG: transposase [Pseudomonadota bacterium]